MVLGRTLIMLFLAVGFGCSHCRACSINESRSHVVTTFEELLSESGGWQFKGGPIGTLNYTELLIDQTNGNILVGARNLVVQIDLANFSSSEVLPWPSSVQDKRNCLLDKKPVEECNNFIKVLQSYQGRLFICGTNSYKPVCTWRNLTDLSRADGRDNKGNVFQKEFDGVGLVPYSPRYDSTAVMSDHGRYYAGTMMDGGAREPVIFSRNFRRRYRVLVTVIDSKWLSDTQFVKSFDLGLYVYFYFREAAVENMNCGKTKFSRVARICKGDYGGSNYVMKNNFVTYNKARLNCSTAGEYPAYYDEIQDVFWDERTSLFYAVFTTQPNGVAGSAVCAYTVQEMERVFGGDYKYRNKDTGQWITKTNQHHFRNCSVKASSQESYTEEQKKLLVPPGKMATPIMTRQAFKDSISYQLMDDIVQPQTTAAQFVKHGERFSTIVVHHVNSAVIVYVGTERGSILKLYTPAGRTSACTIEEIKLFPKGKREPIIKMMLDMTRGFLYVATNSKLIKVKLERCGRHTNRRACLVAHDPYCGWNAGSCRSWTKRTKTSWEQDLTKCPVGKGKWSKWSKWGVCNQDDAESNVCRCRTRFCQHTCDPKDCQGEALQLINCTVDKAYSWVDESTWLTEGVIHGSWRVWADWTPCSVTEGRGYRQRFRFCIRPRNGGRRCVGKSTELERCRVRVPPEEKSVSLVTGVMGVVGKDDMAVRYKYSCHVKGRDLRNMSIALTKTENIDCSYNRDVCKLAPTVLPGLWGPWEDWSKCRLVGMQHRTRTCTDYDKPCRGSSWQDRQCNINSGESTSTPATPDVPDLTWDSWSACMCNLSIKLVPEKESLDPVGLRHRSRRCRETHPNEEPCSKDHVEYGICFCKKAVHARTFDENEIRKTGGYRLGDVVGVAIVTGVLCIVMCAVLAYCVIKRKKNFNVSKAHEKSLNSSHSDSRYERTNGVDYPSESSRDRNSKAKLQPTAKGDRSFTDFFLKRKASPEDV